MNDLLPPSDWRYLPEKLKRGKCWVAGCRRCRGGKHRMCFTHQERKYVVSNPLRRRFQNLKVSAMKRGIKVLLTSQQFYAWAKDVQLIEKNLTVDRVDPWDDYRLLNIRAVPLAENCADGNRDRYWRTQL